jgi:branched-chain amino acid transport system permease protein
MRMMGYCNFGYAAFYGIGAYFSALIAIYYKVPVPLAIMGSLLLTILIGVGYAMLMSHLRGFSYIAMTSWFYGEIIRLIIIRAADITRGVRGLYGIPFIFSYDITPYYYLWLMFFIASIILCFKLLNSKMGLICFAIGNDEDLARSLGINTFKYKVLILTLSTSFAGLTGCFYAHFRGVISPDLLDWPVTLTILIFDLVGGKNSLLGPIIGTFLLVILMETFKFFLEISYIILGVALIVTIIFFPDGIIGIFKYTSRFRKVFI